MLTAEAPKFSRGSDDGTVEGICYPRPVPFPSSDEVPYAAVQEPQE